MSQGDVEGVTAAIEQIASLGPDALHEKGRAGQAAVSAEFSRERLCPLLCDEIEAALSLSRHS